MTKHRIWHLMLLSFFIPVIGGLIVYLLKKNKDTDLANVCLISSFVHPLLIGFITGIILGLFNDLVIMSTTIILGIIFNYVMIKEFFPNNKYRYFIPVFWFGLIGAAYSYYYAYKEDEILKKNVGWFFFFQIFLSIFIFPIISVLLLAV